MFCRNCVRPTESLLQLIVLSAGQEKWKGAEPVAILYTTYRLTMRSVSAHISQWDVKFAGKWDSALKGNSALRPHVARAAGIDLAHREGQHVIHFLWDIRKFYDSIKTHLLIPQLVARGYPLEILVFGLVDTQITETSSSWQRIQRRHHWLCIQHFGQVVSRAVLGPDVFCLNGSKHGRTWFLDRFAKSTQFVTNTSRMQLSHDAAANDRQ